MGANGDAPAAEGAPTGDERPVRLHEALQHGACARELFLPTVHARWRDGRLHIPRDERAALRTQLSGARLREADPQGEDLRPERETQKDLGDVVATLRRLRDEDGLSGLCLDREHRRREPGGRGRCRLHFGLRRGALDENSATRRCERSLRGAIRRGGFRILEPEGFDRAEGLAGLEAWARSLRLKRGFRPAWWWLLPLLLLLPLLDGCPEAPSFFGQRVGNRSLVLLVDVSSSMEPHFEPLRREVARLLKELEDGGDAWVEVVTYAGSADAVLGELRTVDADVRQRLDGWLAGMNTRGGTDLSTGLKRAGELVRAHGKPTSLFVLTDAEDGSIPRMVSDAAGTRGLFGEVPVTMTGLVPRLFGSKESARALNPHEERLARLCELLGGGLGSREER